MPRQQLPVRPVWAPGRMAVILCVLAAICGAARAAEWIWVEGEDALTHTMKPHGWYDSVVRDQLSGGRWLSHFAAGTPPEAAYDVDVPRDATYRLWIRCNTVAAPRMSLRVGKGAWKEIDLSQGVEVINIASDGKPDMRFIGWVDAGELKLSKGTARLTFRFESKNNNHGAIDCFLLTRGVFRPRGHLKPGERSGRASEGFFAWEPDIDAFGRDALVDLRFLNEKVAGAHGRVRARGEGFVLGDGRPVRFWAANAGPGIWGLDHAAHVYLARRLAKTGVNMVRLHGALYGARDPAIDPRKLDAMHHMVHALKQEGIYTALSFYFPLWFHLDGDQRPFMLLFFDAELQAHYHEWARVLLTAPNPYTRIPLGRDPAVAIVECVNEDSHFFWTFKKENMPARRWETFTGLFGAWVKQRYGSIEKAFAAWGGVREPGDDPAAGRVDLYGAWDMTAQGLRANPRRRARVSDQVRFLTENMRGFYEATRARFRSKYGYTGLVVCSNWHVADASLLDALERYCYTTGDVIDRHGYFDHDHKGDGASWSVRPGHEFVSRSALFLDRNNPLPFVETRGYPHIVSEIGWPLPNMYRAESTFLLSAYGSLQGLDGIFIFAISSEGWDQRMGKFSMNTPAVLGCFPAAALVYRRGDVQEAPPIVMDHLRLEDLYALKGTPVHAAGAFDQFRAAEIPEGARKTGAIDGIDPLSFYAGRVVRDFGGKPEQSFQLGMARHIDREARVVRSVTGELAWDFGRGLVTMNTPRAQGAAGFLGRCGRIELDGVAIAMQNDYGSVTVVALDDAPLARASRLLIQAMTIEQFHGFRATGAGRMSGRIESVGAAPCTVEKLRASVTLKLEGPPPASVAACDEHGYRRARAVATTGEDGGFTIVLDPESPYHVVER